MKSDKRKACRVTGMSMLASSGIGNEQVWSSVLNGEALLSTREYKLRNGKTVSYPVYPMPAIRIQDWMSSQTVNSLREEGLDCSPDFIYLLVASLLALRDASLEPSTGKRIALVIGHENLGVNDAIDRILTENTEMDLSGSWEPLQQFHTYRHNFFRLQTFTSLHFLARTLGIGGPVYTVNNACASGIYALEMGRMLLQSDQADAVLVCCSDYAHFTEYMWLKEKGFSSPSLKLRPFDQNRDGAVLGDGAAAVVLETEKQAATRSVIPRAKYLGASTAVDTWHLTLPDVTSHSYANVIQDAIHLYGGGKLDLLVPHGAGSPLWDKFEAAEIHRAFSTCELGIPSVTALKGYFGHTLGANSLLESVLLLHCMGEAWIPPAKHFDETDPKANLPLIRQPIRKRIRRVMKTVCAYGGFQAAAVFEQER